MLPLRDLLRLHLKRLGLTQEQFAERVGMHPTQLSSMLHGRGGVPLERAATWCEALGLRDRDAEDLMDAMHLAAASDRVRVIVERQEKRLVALEETLRRFHAWTGKMKQILQALEDQSSDA